MLSLIFFFNFISRPSHGFDVVHTQLLADVLDVGIHDFFVAEIIIAPDCVQQPFPGYHPALFTDVR